MSNLLTESHAKYLAGLSDADGNLCFSFFKVSGDKFKARLKWSLTTTLSIDKDFRTINKLHNLFSFGSICYPEKRVEHWEQTAIWQIQRQNELEKFIPLIAKYSYIKGKHFMRLLEKRRELGEKELTEAEVKELKEWSKQSRKDAGPIKPKNHPSAAWLAGMIDGDGSLVMKYQEAKRYWRIRFTIAEADNDVCSLYFIQKAFGGEVYQHGKSQTADVRRLEINLGLSNSSKASKFLHYILPHLMMKKHIAEMILAKHKQRLSEKTPAGEATV